MKKTLIISLGVIFLASCSGKKCDKSQKTAMVDSTTQTSCCDSMNKKPCCEKLSEKEKEACCKQKEETTAKKASTTIDQSKLDAAEAAYNEMIAIMNAGGNNYDAIQESRKAYQAVKSGMTEAELAKHIEIMQAKRQAKIDAQK